jgi:hypothetical protein
MVYVIVSFINNEQIEADSEFTKKWISAIVGVLLETASFIYTWLLPLKIAKDITDKKLKSFNRSFLDPNTHSFVGTVVGVCVGATYIVDVVIFSNLNFLFQDAFLENINQIIPCLVISLMLILTIAVFYREIKRELLKIPCIKKMFPKKLRSYTVYNEE